MMRQRKLKSTSRRTANSTRTRSSTRPLAFKNDGRAGRRGQTSTLKNCPPGWHEWGRALPRSLKSSPPKMISVKVRPRQMDACPQANRSKPYGSMLCVLRGAEIC
eukprot:4726157-Prymnesium_polylepis.3